MSIAHNVTDWVGSGPARSPCLNSALNHPRLRVMSLNGVQVEREAHAPCEWNGSPSCPWFCVAGQLRPSLLLTRRPRWPFLLARRPRWPFWAHVSPFPVSLFLFCCSVWSLRRHLQPRLALLLGCLWASFLSLSWGLCISPRTHLTQEAPHLGSSSVLPLLANSFLTLFITANARELPRCWGHLAHALHLCGHHIWGCWTPRSRRPLGELSGCSHCPGMWRTDR